MSEGGEGISQRGGRRRELASSEQHLPRGGGREKMKARVSSTYKREGEKERCRGDQWHGGVQGKGCTRLSYLLLVPHSMSWILSLGGLNPAHTL